MVQCTTVVPPRGKDVVITTVLVPLPLHCTITTCSGRGKDVVIVQCTTRGKDVQIVPLHCTITTSCSGRGKDVVIVQCSGRGKDVVITTSFPLGGRMYNYHSPSPPTSGRTVVITTVLVPLGGLHVVQCTSVLPPRGTRTVVITTV